jgi:hypothetical protein
VVFFRLDDQNIGVYRLTDLKNSEGQMIENEHSFHGPTAWMMIMALVICVYICYLHREETGGVTRAAFEKRMQEDGLAMLLVSIIGVVLLVLLI